MNAFACTGFNRSDEMADFEDLIPIGKTFVSPGRTIGEGDFTLLTSLTWNTTVIHTDREFMKQTPFGERILDGPSLLACAAGLSHRSGYHEATANEQLRTVANLGYRFIPRLPMCGLVKKIPAGVFCRFATRCSTSISSRS
jgi:acyl dehydratase